MINITSNIKIVVKNIQALPGKMEKAGKKTLESAAQTFTNIMQRPGRKPTYPLTWDSEKQRKFVMAKLRRENNLPYQRTGAHVNGWAMSMLPNGYQSANIGHKAVFLWGAASGQFPGATKVQASGQSHLFQDRWPLTHKVLTAVLSRLPAELLEALRIEVNR